MKISYKYYQLVYEGKLAASVPITAALAGIFAKHNVNNRPKRKEIRSMSVGDVIVFNIAGMERAFCSRTNRF